MQNGGLQQLELLEFAMVDLKFSVLVNHACPLCSLNIETLPFWLSFFPWRRQKLVLQAKNKASGAKCCLSSAYHKAEEILPADGVLVSHGHPFFALGLSSFHAPQTDLTKRSSCQRQKQQHEFCDFC